MKHTGCTIVEYLKKLGHKTSAMIFFCSRQGCEIVDLHAKQLICETTARQISYFYSSTSVYLIYSYSEHGHKHVFDILTQEFA